jgi:hypothetical protein
VRLVDCSFETICVATDTRLLRPSRFAKMGSHILVIPVGLKTKTPCVCVHLHAPAGKSTHAHTHSISLWHVRSHYQCRTACFPSGENASFGEFLYIDTRCEFIETPIQFASKRPRTRVSSPLSRGIIRILHDGSGSAKPHGLLFKMFAYVRHYIHTHLLLGAVGVALL